MKVDKISNIKQQTHSFFLFQISFYGECSTQGILFEVETER